MSSFSRRKVGVLLLVAVLLAPWAAAAEPGTGAEHQGSRSPWALLAQLWSVVTALWSNNGCSMVPYGVCGDGSTAPEPTENLNNGCSVDPFGRCGDG